MRGAFSKKLGIGGLDTLMKSLDKQLHGKSDKVMDLNREAMKRGAALAA